MYIREILIDPHKMARIISMPPLDESSLDENERTNIQVAVESLPDNIRDVIELLFWGQEGTTEIAAILDIPKASVYVLMEKGLALLAEQLSIDD